MNNFYILINGAAFLQIYVEESCSVQYLVYLNCNEMVLSNTNVIFQIIFCQVTLLKNPEVKPDDLDALLMS